VRRGLLLAAVPLVLLTGCGTVVNHKDLESKLSQYLQLEFGSRVDVACPKNQSAGEGKTFSCTATAPGGRKFKVGIRMQDDHGGFVVAGLTPEKPRK
jgi:hypothetical protein